jgi:DNA-binding XRE family transcriptional regulator
MASMTAVAASAHVMAVHQSEITKVTVLRWGFPDNDLEIALSIDPVSDVTATEADHDTAFRNRRVLPLSGTAIVQLTIFFTRYPAQLMPRIWHCSCVAPGLADIVAGGGLMDHDNLEPTNILTALGRNLKARRLSAGLTQGQVAAIAGVPLALVAQVENGCSDPTLDLLDDLAVAVGCEARELL